MEEKMKRIVSTLITLVLGGGIFYLWHPSLNIASFGIWGFVTSIVFIYACINWIIDESECEYSRFTIVPFIASLGIPVLGLLVMFFCSPLFCSKAYYDQATISEMNFSEMAAPSTAVSDIAAMDSVTADSYGGRQLGELSSLVTSFRTGKDYSQLSLAGKPMKVAPLEYAGAFKYFANKEEGIPGYILVDPVNFTAKYVDSDNFFYSQSACFGKDLRRHVQFQYPAKILGKTFFEVDEEGTQYWVTSVLEPKAGILCKVPVGVIITDAITGVSTYVENGSVPEWVDIVFDGDTVCQMYDWHGKYKNGFWNSCFAQKDCSVTTDDFGYKVIGSDVYIYTGVKSASTDGHSAIGFILVNSRTGEMSYMSIGGADEASAMAAAAGEVQQYGYVASFPSIVNVNNEPVYFMVLTDENSIVKRYAMVNFKAYDQIAVGETQKEVFSKYIKMVSNQSEVMADNTAKAGNITVNEVIFIVEGGDTTVYIKAADGNTYKCAFDEYWILVDPGQEISVTYEDGAVRQLYNYK